MDRSSQHEAIVLHVRPVGDIHVSADLLTQSAGMIHVTAYGARSNRGSLRGKVVPFASGTAYLYYQPNRDAYKVSDYDVSDYHLGIQESLRSYYGGSFVAEIVRRTFAGGGDTDGEAFNLVKQTFQWLDEFGTPTAGSTARAGGIRGTVQSENRDSPGDAAERPGRYGAEFGSAASGTRVSTTDTPEAETNPGNAWNHPSTRLLRLLSVFMWRYLDLLGLQPAPEAIDEERRSLRFDLRSDDAGTASAEGRRLSPGIVRFLKGTHEMALDQAAAVQLQTPAVRELFRAMLDLTQGAIQGEIKSLSLLTGAL